MQAALSGEPPSVVLHRIQETVPQSVVSSAKFWPVVTAVNFAVVPAHLRFMVSGGFAVVWQTYLSFVNRRAEIEGPVGGLVMEGHREIFEVSVAGETAEEKTLDVLQDVVAESDAPVGSTSGTDEDDDETLKVVAVVEDSVAKSSDSMIALVEAVVERVTGASEDGPISAAVEESITKSSESVKELVEAVVETVTGSSDDGPESPSTSATTDGDDRPEGKTQVQTKEETQSLSRAAPAPDTPEPPGPAAGEPPDDLGEPRPPTQKATKPRKGKDR